MVIIWTNWHHSFCLWKYYFTLFCPLHLHFVHLYVGILLPFGNEHKPPLVDQNEMFSSSMCCIYPAITGCSNWHWWALDLNRKCGPAPPSGRLALMRLFGEKYMYSQQVSLFVSAPNLVNIVFCVYSLSNSRNICII